MQQAIASKHVAIEPGTWNADLSGTSRTITMQLVGWSNTHRLLHHAMRMRSAHVKGPGHLQRDIRRKLLPASRASCACARHSALCNTKPCAGFHSVNALTDTRSSQLALQQLLLLQTAQLQPQARSCCVRPLPRLDYRSGCREQHTPASCQVFCAAAGTLTTPQQQSSCTSCLYHVF